MEEKVQGQNENSINGYSYKVLDTEVIVRNRPRKLVLDIHPDDDSEAYLSVTDTFVEVPKDKSFVWLPWNEDRKPTPDFYYGVNRTLLYWIYYKKVKSVQIFCDGGTHRSVTAFGCFLYTYFKDQMKDIVAKAVPLGMNIKYSENPSNPIQYIEGYLKEQPEDMLFLDQMGKDYLGRFDSINRVITKRVKERFDINN